MKPHFSDNSIALFDKTLALAEQPPLFATTVQQNETDLPLILTEGLGGNNRLLGAIAITNRGSTAVFDEVWRKACKTAQPPLT